MEYSWSISGLAALPLSAWLSRVSAVACLCKTTLAAFQSLVPTSASYVCGTMCMSSSVGKTMPTVPCPGMTFSKRRPRGPHEPTLPLIPSLPCSSSHDRLVWVYWHQAIITHSCLSIYLCVAERETVSTAAWATHPFFCLA